MCKDNDTAKSKFLLDLHAQVKLDKNVKCFRNTIFICPKFLCSVQKGWHSAFFRFDCLTHRLWIVVSQELKSSRLHVQKGAGLVLFSMVDNNNKKHYNNRETVITADRSHHVPVGDGRLCHFLPQLEMMSTLTFSHEKSCKIHKLQLKWSTCSSCLCRFN